MTKLRQTMLATAASAAIALTAAPASAIDIVLRPDASFASAPGGADALFAFRKAANYWNKTLGGSNVQINIAVSYQQLAPNVIGSTGSNAYYLSTKDFYQILSASAATPLDAIATANLVPLSNVGGLNFVRPGALTGDSRTGTGINPNSLIYDNNNSANNLNIIANGANLKALGFTVADGLSSTDASVTFSSAFQFDFNPTNGISVGSQDFIAVATHELGHALGFVSGTDDYDYYATLGNIAYRFDNLPALTTLDLFRYSDSLFNPATGKRYLMLAPGRGALFSLDGTTPFNGDGTYSQFATGSSYGDGDQASHWKDSSGYFQANGCFVAAQAQIGIMDPTSGDCQPGIVTANDLAAFDAIGYNLDFDVTKGAGKNYQFTTSQIFGLAGLATVPEPSTWTMMIAGFGLVGGAMRRRRAKTSVRFAI